MAIGSGPSIGLDIGTSAVRAAVLTPGKGARSLVRFAQVPLPQGAVTAGEIRDSGAVSEAIAQLFKRAKVRAKRAVIGVANQRVVVRQIDIPFLEEKELRASLRFQVAEHIPMPIDDAELDFQVLDDYVTESGERMMRLLLVAADRTMVQSFVEATTSAGIQPAGVDLTPFAIARAVSQSARGESGLAGAEAIVDVGAGITNIIVHHNGEPRFVRILLIGGDDTTSALASGLDLSFDEAEAMKLDMGRGAGNGEATDVLRDRVDAVVGEIRGSLEYYSSQEDSEPISSVVVSGGGSLTPGFMEQLEGAAGAPVRTASPLAEMNVKKSGLTQEQVVQIEPVAAAAVGLAMGGAAS